jgi:hypothetical protein
MIQRIGALHGLVLFDRRRLSRKAFSLIVSGSAALILSGLVGAWILYVRSVAVLTAAEATAASAPTVVSNPYGALLAPRFFSGSTPVSFAQSSPLESKLGSYLPVQSSALLPAPSSATPEPEYVLPMPAPVVSGLTESTPLPPPRPTIFGLPRGHSPLQVPVRHLPPQNFTAALPAIPSDNRTFFQKLFGAPQAAGPALAYAAPESGAVDNARNITSNPLPRYDQWTAVYDVAAHTVYLPHGTKLEAHSGLGDRIDDPRHVGERDRGATPPQVYELQPREKLFHGVHALRLKPVGSGSVFGRVGLLAHTYMLGPKGDSNGCVSFKNYNAFLQAFQNGEVKRLVVVARLD